MMHVKQLLIKKQYLLRISTGMQSKKTTSTPVVLYCTLEIWQPAFTTEADASSFPIQEASFRLPCSAWRSKIKTASCVAACSKLAGLLPPDPMHNRL